MHFLGWESDTVKEKVVVGILLNLNGRFLRQYVSMNVTMENMH